MKIKKVLPRSGIMDRRTKGGERRWEGILVTDDMATRVVAKSQSAAPLREGGRYLIVMKSSLLTGCDGRNAQKPFSPSMYMMYANFIAFS